MGIWLLIEGMNESVQVLKRDLSREFGIAPSRNYDSDVARVRFCYQLVLQSAMTP